MSYQFYMYGAQMGTLYVDMDANADDSWTMLTSHGGGWTMGWQSRTFSLSSYVGGDLVVRFMALIGSGSLSDIAIDEVEIKAWGY